MIRTLPNAPRVDVLGAPLDLMTVPDLLAHITASAKGQSKAIVTYANVHTVNLSRRIAWYRSFLHSATAVYCDGIGLMGGARVLGWPISHQNVMTAPDFLDELGQHCSRDGLSIYLLGGEPGVADAAVRRLEARAPGIMAYGHHGFFAKSGPENDSVIDAINAASPDILCIGFGSPLQERWVIDNLERLDARVFFPVGACLDYYSGRAVRCPAIVSRLGVEWLFRLAAEPQRLWRRYLVGNPRFLADVAIAAFSRRSRTLRSAQ
jgi:N-acetylglucosaminyldiphosphoundecaprenol N-acetyl-beta-D-mannosaminyltransferase